MVRWVALRRDVLVSRWARLRGRRRSVTVAVETVASLAIVGDVTVTVGRSHPDRDAISDRDWLALLDDQMDSVYQRLDSVQDLSNADRRDHADQLAYQAEALRAEMLAATQQGWWLIVAGLVFTATGTILGFWA